MFESSLQTLLQWCESNPEWLGVMVGLISFLESLALVGIVMPGVVLLAGLAALAAAADVSLLIILSCAFIGAVCGDGLSYLIGRFYKLRITLLWPFKRKPEIIESGQAFFDRHGGKSVVIGRFVGPVRPVIPLVAGLLSMRASRFFTLNIMSAFAWAPFYILPGYFGGQLLSNPEAYPSAQASLIILSCSIASGLLLLMVYQGTISQVSHPRRWLLFSLFSVFLVWTIAALNSSLLNALDAHISQVMMLSQAPLLRDFLILVTLLGDGYLLYAASLLLLLWMALNGVYKTGFKLLFAGALLAIVTHTLKSMLAVDRPELVAMPPASMAYPSGHVSGLSLWILCIYAILLRVLGFGTGRTQILGALLALLLGTVAFSRIYLGVHWFSDLVGGFLLAACFGEYARAIVQNTKASLQTSGKNLMIFGVAWCVTLLIYIGWRFPAARMEYALSAL